MVGVRLVNMKQAPRFTEAELCQLFIIVQDWLDSTEEEDTSDAFKSAESAEEKLNRWASCE